MKQKEVGREIHALSNLLGRKIEAERRRMGMEDITPMQTWIVRYLYEHRERDVFQRDVEQDFSITRSTVTGILKLMEKNELIQRVSVPQDARLKKLTLTETGEAVYHRVVSHIEETERTLVRGMTGEEVQQLFLLFGKIRRNLEE